MIALVIGGSASGKSEYAEQYLDVVAEGRKKYYIATMHAYDGESKERIKRHKKMRAGKRFSTIEQPVDIDKAAEKMEAGKKAALLECISNLAANEMFSGKIPETGNVITKKIVRGIEVLAKEADHLVIVSNNIFEDGNIYEKDTMEYISTMGRINRKLAEMADEVIEVAAGIPVIIKAEG